MTLLYSYYYYHYNFLYYAPRAYYNECFDIGWKHRRISFFECKKRDRMVERLKCGQETYQCAVDQRRLEMIFQC